MRIAAISIGVTAALCVLGTAARADDARPYKEGPVSAISYIRTKPGKFDDYVKFLGTTYKAMMDEEKKQGLILGYKVYEAYPRSPSEPDIILETIYPNMAGLDKSEQEDAIEAKMAGSLEAANKAYADRESIRTTLGGDLIREIILK